MKRILSGFKNLSIKLKFLFSFMLISSLILPLSYLFVDIAKKNNTAFDILVNDTFPDIEYLMELRNVAIQIQILTNGFIVYKGETTQTEGSKSANLKLELLALFSELDKWLELYLSIGSQANSNINQQKIITEYKDRILFSSLNIIESFENQASEIKIKEQREALRQSENELKAYLTILINTERNKLSIEKNKAEQSINTALKIMVIFSIFSIIISFVLSFLLTKIISQPIIYLRDFAVSIMNLDKVENIKISSKDEIGQLSLSLNNMINNLFAYKEKIESLNLEMVRIARLAGMAEVATSILHNLGNILNSVKVSVNLLQERMVIDNLESLTQLLTLISTNRNTLAYYFTEDPQGKLLPDFLLLFLEELVKTNNDNQEELARLKNNIKHIEDIVSMQRVISGATILLNEDVLLVDVIERAIKMCDAIANNKFIKIQRNLENNLTICTDQSKLLQILVNLIKNSKEALISLADEILQPTISITLQVASAANFIEIIITDNGIGIEAENLANIFSQGYTTKITGHGFGLHTCALSAKELGGSLQVHSKGKGQGAAFILTLPLIPRKRDYKDES